MVRKAFQNPIRKSVPDQGLASRTLQGLRPAHSGAPIAISLENLEQSNRMRPRPL